MLDLNQRIEEEKEQLIQAVQELVRIKSVYEEQKTESPREYPFGKGVDDALNCALSIAKRWGLEVKNLDGYAGYAEYGDGEDYVAVLGHVDVVPEEEGGPCPPYEARIVDGRLYGRGTVDDKGPILAALFGLKILKEQGAVLSKKVRIIFGTNEETGTEDMEYYKARENMPICGFTPDAEFPAIFAEKGLMNLCLATEYEPLEASGAEELLYLTGGTALNCVPPYAEASIRTSRPEELIRRFDAYQPVSGIRIEVKKEAETILLKAFGTAAHASVPEMGKNAVMGLVDCIGKLGVGSESLQEKIRFLNERIGMEVNGASMNIGLEDEPSGKLTLNVGMIEIKEGTMRLGIDIRYPVTSKESEVSGPVKALAEANGFEVPEIYNDDPMYFPKDHFMVESLVEVYNEYFGRNEEAVSMGGGTYAKYMKNIIAFGPLMPGQECTEHTSGEYIELDQLVTLAQVYAQAIFKLAK